MLRIAYTTTFNAQEVKNWSGTPYHMSQAFEQQGSALDYIGNLQHETPAFFKIKQLWKKYIAAQRESPRFNLHAAKFYSLQAAQKLKHSKANVIVSPLINPIAFLDCKQPIVLWTDALYAALVGFYAPFSSHSTSTIRQGNLITQQALKRATLAIFSSTWAANSAIELYGVSPEKVKVVPFGANLTGAPSYTEIKTIIEQRDPCKINLLFLAKSWERKGGDIVIAVTKALYEAGYPVQLNIVGHTAPTKIIPPYLNYIGYLSKHRVTDQQKLKQLLFDTHLLFVPSRAEAYGIVFCEANAYGIPCLTSHVGGIGTVIRNNINGMTFSLEAEIEDYCNYIIQLMQDHERYKTLALSAYNEFKTRLNWQVATAKVTKMLAALNN